MEKQGGSSIDGKRLFLRDTGLEVTALKGEPAEKREICG
jgi:hypothetical protein